MARTLLFGIVLVAALATAPAALAAAPASPARASTAADHGVTATVTYSGRSPLRRALKLTISRDGQTAYHKTISSRYCGHDCDVVIGAGAGTPVQVVDLTGHGTPEVLLSLFTGGAHCCSVAQVFSYDSRAGTYRETERNFGDPGYRLKRLGGRGRELVSADDAFAYTFTDFADSALPIQIVAFSGGRFHEVTGHYPGLVAKDGARWLSAYKRMARSHYADSVGVIAAWAADEDRLGHAASVNRYLDQQARAGHLNSALYGAKGSGSRFVAKLQSFLRRHGYLS